MAERERPKRKAIPDRIRLEVVLRQNGLCTHCGERLGPLKGLNFDHRPAIINRPVNEAGTDYVPPQLDPEFIEAIHEIPCHRVRTAGPGGEKRITTAGSDIGIRDKTKRLVEKRERREAAAAEADRELSELPLDDQPEIQRIKFEKPKSRIAKRANPWPPKKARTPYRRKGV